ncbi:MAG: GTP-binding protein [Methanomassiliicoccales archaeon]
MPNIEEQIREVEEEIRRTDYNKKTQHHIGLLKAKLARLRMESEKRRKAQGGGEGYAVRKTGNATVALVGFPSVGKSTVLNKITNASSEVAAYAFTTLTVVPGLLEYRGARIQVLDLPGLIRDASKGKGRGREVLSVVRAADLIVLLTDVFEPNISVLLDELHAAGIRPNQSPPRIQIVKKVRGGISVSYTVSHPTLSPDDVRSILNEFGYYNADVVIRENADADRLIDALAGSRVYIPLFLCINKIDLVGEEKRRQLIERFAGFRPVLISAETGEGLAELKERIFEELRFVRVYMKPPGGEADMKEPLLVREGSTVADVCDFIHRDLRKKFRYALMWGPSSRFPGQIVGQEHVVMDGDILTIVARK